MSFDHVAFKINPNLYFKSVVSEKCDCLGGNCNFEVFKNKNDQKTYLIAPYFDITNIMELKFTLKIISLEDNKIVKELEGHEDRILNVRYFYNEITQKQYLVSADKKNFVIVWEITDDYKLLKKLEFKFEGFIYSNVLFFKNDSIYLITSSIGHQGCVKILDITKNDPPEDITSTKDFPIYFMTLYQNKTNTKNYLILNGKKKIKIIQIFPENENEDLFIKEFTTEEKKFYNLGGLIYNFNNYDYYICSNTNGTFVIINLEIMEQVGDDIKFDGLHFYNVVEWNEKYLLFLDPYNRRVNVLDINDHKIKSKMVFPELKYPRYMKKVIHPIYGEALLAIGVDFKINLYVNRSITKFND